MKLHVVMLCAAFALASPVASSAAGSATPYDFNGDLYMGVKLGASEQQVVDVLGDPYQIKNLPGLSGSTLLSYIYDDSTVLFIVEAGHRVMQIARVPLKGGSLSAGSNDVPFGATLAEITKLHGAPREIDSTYSDGSKGVYYTIAPGVQTVYTLSAQGSLYKIAVELSYEKIAILRKEVPAPAAQFHDGTSMEKAVVIMAKTASSADTAVKGYLVQTACGADDEKPMAPLMQITLKETARRYIMANYRCGSDPKPRLTMFDITAVPVAAAP